MSRTTLSSPLIVSAVRLPTVTETVAAAVRSTLVKEGTSRETVTTLPDPLVDVVVEPQPATITTAARSPSPFLLMLLYLSLSGRKRRRRDSNPRWSHSAP